MTEALRELPTAAENVRDRTEFIITAAWEAFSSPTSIASLEILIATRAVRNSGAAEHLAQLATTFGKLGKHIREGLDARHALVDMITRYVDGGDDRMNPVGAHSANQCSILARCSQARSASRF